MCIVANWYIGDISDFHFLFVKDVFEVSVKDIYIILIFILLNSVHNSGQRKRKYFHEVIIYTYFLNVMNIHI